MSDTHNERTEPEQGKDSGGAIEVGRRLRKAREESDIDINELAARLRLTASQLEAVEAGRLDQFGAPIYARGYVANYAKLVGLKPDPLMALLPDGDRAPPLEAATAMPPGQRLAENIARVATYAIGTVVLALPVLWWASEGSMDALFGEPPASENSIDVSGTESTEPGSGAAAEPAGGHRDPAGRSSADQPVMASMAMPRNARTAQSEQPDEEVGSGANGTASPDKNAEAARAEPELVLEVSADSWVEVRDNAGERLEYDLLRAGTIHRYTGVAPFRVLIGNAGAVTVRYNGAPFDTAPFVQGDLARFEVGVEAEPAEG